MTLAPPEIVQAGLMSITGIGVQGNMRPVVGRPMPAMSLLRKRGPQPR